MSLLLEKGVASIIRATDKAVEIVGELKSFGDLEGHDLAPFLREDANLSPGQLAFNTTPLAIRSTIHLKGQAKATIEIEYSTMSTIDGAYPVPKVEVRWSSGEMSPPLAVLLAQEHQRAGLLACHLEVLFVELGKILATIESTTCTSGKGRRKGPRVHISDILNRFHEQTTKRLDRARSSWDH